MIEYIVKICDDGTEKWYLNGKLHREDGPAIKYADGDKVWYKEGLVHREDGPAIEYPDGSKFWYKNDKLHREDGPAIERADGVKEWYLNGRSLPEEEFNKRMNSHTVVIDGKEIVISSKSFEAMKDFFKNTPE